MVMEKDLDKFYSDLSTNYDEVRTYTYKIDFVIDKMQREIVLNMVKGIKPSNVLEIGPGTGRLTIPVAKRLKRSNILAMDISKDMLKQIDIKLKKLSLDNVKLKQGNVCKLKLPENKYDLVYSMRVIWHLEGYKSVLSNINDSCKKGGYLIFDFPNKWGYWHIFTKLFPKTTKFKVPVFFLNYFELKRLLKKKGFKIVSIRGLHTVYWPVSLFRNKVPTFYVALERFLSPWAFIFSKYLMVKVKKIR